MPENGTVQALTDPPGVPTRAVRARRQNNSKAVSIPLVCSSDVTPVPRTRDVMGCARGLSTSLEPVAQLRLKPLSIQREWTRHSPTPNSVRVGAERRSGFVVLVSPNRPTCRSGASCDAERAPNGYLLPQLPARHREDVSPRDRPRPSLSCRPLADMFVLRTSVEQAGVRSASPRYQEILTASSQRSTR